MKKLLKKFKPIVYISFFVYILLIAFIIVESSLPSSLSSKRSQAVTDIAAAVINSNTDPITPDKIGPARINKVTDSSVLGKSTDGYSNIAIGTTTLLSLEVEYPSSINKSSEVYDFSYMLNKKLGNENHYSIKIYQVQLKTIY